MSVDDRPPDPDLDADLLPAAHAALADPNIRQIAVAVSGGGDSIALLHLLHRAAGPGQVTLHAVTVDHGLRPESALEAAGVAAFCASLGIAHTTLQWRDHSPTGNLMDNARQARRRMISDWALAAGIGHIAIGHTADDEAETFLMGLARASGLDGLAGMRSNWADCGVIWQRPLLRHSRADLRAYLVRHGIAWVDDPTNDDDHYTRIKARKALAALAPLGITIKSLTTSISHLNVARQALQQGLAMVAQDCVTTPGGAVKIGKSQFASLPADTQRRLLVLATAWLSSSAYPPRSTKQITLLHAALTGRDATLNGCRLRHTAGHITLTREPRAVALNQPATQTPTHHWWDNRWCVDGPHADDLTLRALGAAGLRACKNWHHTGLSRDALLVSPAVWRGDALISAPLAGFNPEWTASIPTPFDKFILSH